MKWINVKAGIPKPWQVVWIYWRNREVLLGCRIYEGDDETACPPEEGWYSFEDGKCRWTYWWMPVSESRCNKPDAPHICKADEESKQDPQGS